MMFLRGDLLCVLARIRAGVLVPMQNHGNVLFSQKSILVVPYNLSVAALPKKLKKSIQPFHRVPNSKAPPHTFGRGSLLFELDKIQCTSTTSGGPHRKRVH